jgi:hypothetical protein
MARIAEITSTMQPLHDAIALANHKKITPHAPTPPAAQTTVPPTAPLCWLGLAIIADAPL